MRALRMKTSEHKDNNKKQDVIVVVDGSGSINRATFENEVKQCVLALAARFDPSCQMACIQFGSSATVESELTSDRTVFETRVFGMRQNSGGTNAEAALEKAIEVFSRTTRPENARQVWFITDGDYDSDPTLIAQKLKRQNVALCTAIGVGPQVTIGKLQKISSFGRTFKVQDFAKAYDFVTNEVAVELPREQYASISVQTLVGMSKLGTEIPLQICISNIGTHSICKDSQLLISGKPYFLQETIPITDVLNTHDSVTTVTVLKPRNPSKENSHSRIGGTTIPVLPAHFVTLIDDLPGLLQLQLLDPSGKTIELREDAAIMECELFAGDARHFRIPAQSVNLLLFGPTGAGKSCLVNGILTTISDRVQSIDISGGDHKGITSDYLEFHCGMVSGFDGFDITFYDSPGLEIDDDYGAAYKGDEVGLMLDGILKPNTQVVGKVIKYDDLQLQRDAADIERSRMIHVMVLAIPQATVESSEEMRAFIDIYKKVAHVFKRPVVIAVTYMDEVASLDESENVLKRVAKEFGIGRRLICPIRNYFSEKEKDFEMDRRLMRLLYTCLNEASTFLTREHFTPAKSQFPVNHLAVHTRGTNSTPSAQGFFHAGSLQSITNSNAPPSSATLLPVLTSRQSPLRIVGSSAYNELQIVSEEKLVAFIKAMLPPPTTDDTGVIITAIEKAFRETHSTKFKDANSRKESLFDFVSRYPEVFAVRLPLGPSKRGIAMISLVPPPPPVVLPPSEENMDDDDDDFLDLETDEDGVPTKFKCPISGVLMEDPVTIDDGTGVSYERSAITAWIDSKGTSPLTRKSVTRSSVQPDAVLLTAIERFGREEL
ncbi:hypothetical protein HDU93_004845 [Gonapodya sp. JEL0774]|nr:hypothetical protein HDU93_004845 [Gonapodya sp. JEL0774]